MYRALKKIVWRHPLTSALDLCMFTGIMVCATAIAVIYDFESVWTQLPPRERALGLWEIVALGLLFLCGTGMFIWRRMLEDRQDMAERQATERALQHQTFLAMADMLTSLPNRRAFWSALEKATAEGKTFALFLMDLNGFKSINDRYGHAAGDAVLQAVAMRFRNAARTNDMIARLGGDEFAGIAVVDTPSQAREIGFRFVNSLQNGVEAEGFRHPVGVAVGIALWPNHGYAVEDLMRCADIAMYEAKNESQSAIRIFHELGVITSLKSLGSPG